MNLAFYTYFFGSNNNVAFKIPKLPTIKYKCYYYTNNSSLLNEILKTKWHPIFVNVILTDDIIENNFYGKHIKTCPHKYKELKDYDYVCFLDSKSDKVSIDFVEDFIKKYFIAENYALLLREHWFIHNNIWNEFNESMKQRRYLIQKEKILTYINKQKTNGLKEITDHHCACGFLIRNMKHNKINEINEIWYSHIQECGIQDQISFFFVKQLFDGYIYSFTEDPFKYKKHIYKMQIKYGIKNNNIDVTNICFNKLLNNNIITIPSNDHNRAHHFTDPINGTLKKIFIIIDDNIKEYDDTQTIKINLNTKIITTQNNNDINTKLSTIHQKLKLKYGSFNEELPEQKMVVRYLTGKEKVLEIGSNIGRNSLIIASIIKNKNFLTLESDKNIFNQLNENKTLNNFNFLIENSALSKRKLIQKGWYTMVSDKLLRGYKWVNTINWKDLNDKYNIKFDTLVLDCEGAFYYILMDMPEILNNINLIIMENDYHNIEHKKYINNVLKTNNFYVDYVQGGGWGPCGNNFFEVWKK